MAKSEGFVGAPKFGEGFVWEDKETKEDDKRWMGRTRHEGGEYNLAITGRRSHVRVDTLFCYLHSNPHTN